MMKTRKCSLCDSPAFSKGFCKIHMSKSIIKNSREKTKQRQTEKQDIRNSYFEYHLERCTHSEESLKEILNPTRANICHIFDKARHPSLENNISNCIWLLFSEHERFDKLLFSLEFQKLEKEFKVWKLVLERIVYLLPVCKENTVFTRAIEKYLDGREIKG